MASNFFLSRQLRPFLVCSKNLKFPPPQKCDYSDEKHKDFKTSTKKFTNGESKFSELLESSSEVKPFRKAPPNYNPQKLQSLLQSLYSDQVTKYLKCIVWRRLLVRSTFKAKKNMWASNIIKVFVSRDKFLFIQVASAYYLY